VLGSFWQYHHGLLTLLCFFFFLQARLIEGIIDQVDEVVHVSWVQPRVLGIDQVKSLRDRLDTWIGKVDATLLSVEAETPDLVSS
jgi:26S proteasome regulatory subunit N9